jgi:integrase
MASIENRSRFVVTVQNREDLTTTFACNREAALKAHIAQLKAAGFKPKLTRTNDYYAIRIREAGKRIQCLYANSEQEAIDIKQRVELERRNGLFIDYAKGRSVTLADLMARYLREESPRHKGFEVEGYVINAMLADAGLARVDIEQAYREHRNPHTTHEGKVFRKPSGKTVRQAAPATCFIRKPFADIVPDDFSDYVDDRCQSVEAATVNREIDVLSAVCHIAIDTWRIPVAKNPMDGVRRPKFFNERDRRLVDGEEARLLTAAYEEDAQHSIERRLEALMPTERTGSQEAATLYKRKTIVKAARAQYLSEAEASYAHVPWMETFIQFQLMTGARRGETMTLTWANINLANQTAFIPESKNGRPRELALRSDVIALLEALPRNGELIFPMSVDALRRTWARICTAAGLVGQDELHIHDLRHEAISRIADANGRLPDGFTLAHLKAISGHRDTRMLLRYTHLCIPALAKRLDEAFADETQTVIHRGRRRLKKGANLSISELVAGGGVGTARVSSSQPTEVDQPSNVIQLRPRKVA